MHLAMHRRLSLLAHNRLYAHCELPNLALAPRRVCHPACHHAGSGEACAPHTFHLLPPRKKQGRFECLCCVVLKSFPLMQTPHLLSLNARLSLSFRLVAVSNAFAHQELLLGGCSDFPLSFPRGKKSNRLIGQVRTKDSRKTEKKKEYPFKKRTGLPQRRKPGRREGTSCACVGCPSRALRVRGRPGRTPPPWCLRNRASPHP